MKQKDLPTPWGVTLFKGSLFQAPLKRELAAAG